MLLEIAIGDAYGAGFEFSARDKINAYNIGTTFIEHDLGLSAGHYTDDTQMSIALAEMLLFDIEFTQENCAEFFIHTFKRDQRLGYAKGFQTLLEACENGADLIRKIKPISIRNGAAMRSVPLGLINNIDQLLHTAKIQASVTHNTTEGILSSQIIALAANKLIYEKYAIKDLPGLIQTTLNFTINTHWQKEVQCDAVQTIHAVFSALVSHTSMGRLLIDCVNYGGDVDSVAAIALGLASLSTEYEQDIHPNLFFSLENHNYGFDFLKKLDQQLQQKYLRG
jgi:ADP-ribosyl-[dinitrogen reductase] hydrolase